MSAYKADVVFVRHAQARFASSLFPFDAIFALDREDGWDWEIRLPVERPYEFPIGAKYVLSIDEHIAE